MRTRGLLVALLFVLVAGCHRKPAPAPTPVPPAPSPKQNLVVLLQQEDGTVGRLVVSNPAGSQQLDQANQAVRIARSDAPPSAPFTMEEAERQSRFGAVLSRLPAAEVHFDLYFQTGGTALTAESEALLPEIQKSIESRRAGVVSITGHTDTTGDSASNYALGLQRAEWVARYLRSRGVAVDQMPVSSHGEADLLVATADNTAEPRNRRVEVVVW